MTVPGHPTIRALVQLCLKNLDDILNSELPDDQYSWARRCQLRLRIFSDLLGVCGDGHISVEHRLRTNPSKKYVLTLLLEAASSKIQLWISLGKHESLGNDPESLDEVSSNALGIFQDSEYESELSERVQTAPGSPSTSENEGELADQDGEGEQPESSRPDTAGLIENVLASLISYAAFIKSQNKFLYDFRAEGYEPKDESGQSLIPSFMASARSALDGKLSELSEPSGLHPKYATANNLRARFEHTILKRWRNLCYCRYRAERFIEAAETPGAAQASCSETPQKQSSLQTEKKTSTLRCSVNTANPLVISALTAPTSVAPTDEPTRISGPTDMRRLKDTFEFVCPLCHIPQRVIGGQDELRRAWRKHAIRDLAPYICLYAQCSSPNVMYHSLDDWTRHVEAEHIQPRLTCRECRDASGFETETAFQNHMREYHDELLSDGDMEKVTADSWKRRAKFTQCLLCGSAGVDNPGELNQDEEQLHNLSLQCMTQHMLSIALISLPEDSSLASNSGDSSTTSGAETDEPRVEYEGREAEFSDS